ncbi:hypothetical protein CSUI_008291, partial [Cystoisospora suis]
LAFLLSFCTRNIDAGRPLGDTGISLYRDTQIHLLQS